MTENPFLKSICVLVLSSMVACDPPQPPRISIEPQNTAAANLPPARVDLPAAVKLEGTLPPETHADGKMRVDGLVTRREKYFEQKIVVRGVLVDKYECPEDATRCQHHHAYLADTPAGGDKKLLLVGLSDSVNEALVAGTEYVVTGNFAKRTDDGFVASMGLLVFESAEGLEIKEDPKGSKRGR